MLFFLASFHVFSDDLSFLDTKILADRFEINIYNKIKDIVANGACEKENNITIFSLNNAKVEIIENVPSKTRGYNNPDTIIIFTDQSLKIHENIEEIIIIFNKKADFYKLTVKKSGK